MDNQNGQGEVICVKCGEGTRDGDPLNQIGRFWSEEKGPANPLNTLIDYAFKSNLTSLESKLKSNKEKKIPTYIHLSCRTRLKNQSRSKRAASTGAEHSSKRKNSECFDFKTCCFYCGIECIFDKKHPERNQFIEVRTISSNIHKQTLTICKVRDDQMESLIKSPLKCKALSQAVVAATRPRTIMPLQFSLAVSVDNRVGSKWLNTVLSKMGFAVSYDEVTFDFFMTFFLCNS